MDLEVRPVTDDDLPRFWRVLFTAFGNEPTEERVTDERDITELDRAIAVVDGSSLVGTAGAHSFELTLPGGTAVPAAGVTSVSVLATHRRRGALRLMMRHQLDDVIERGEPIAVLTASEAPIYGRFGYGLATRINKVSVDTRDGLPLRTPADRSGTFRMLEPDEVIATLVPLHEAVVRSRPGELRRTAKWWDVNQRDRTEWRDGGSHKIDVVHEQGGVVDGAITYRVKPGRDDNGAAFEVLVRDVLAADPEVELSLLEYAAEVDLTATMTVYARIDHPLPLRLIDRRRYHVQDEYDHLYVRVLDVPHVLAARTYEGTGRLVLAVNDPFLPAAGGRFVLDVAADGSATCERVGDDSDGDADVRLDADTLGAIVLGDVTPSVLAAARRLTPSSPAALRLADRLFPTAVAPACSLDF